MRCPNCRCFVPGSMTYCGYCGYEFSSGAAKTLTVDQVYVDSFYGEYDYYSYYDNLQYLAYENFYNDDVYSRLPQQTENPEVLSTEAALALTVGGGSVFLLIFLAILIILL